jgi:hypothetical protein
MNIEEFFQSIEPELNAYDEGVEMGEKFYRKKLKQWIKSAWVFDPDNAHPLGEVWEDGYLTALEDILEWIKDNK